MSVPPALMGDITDMCLFICLLYAQMKLSMAERAASIVEGTPGVKLYANEPYFQPGTRYKGLPK